MNTQAHGVFQAHSYCLMPGDATCYRFGFFKPSEAQEVKAIATIQSYEYINSNAVQEPDHVLVMPTIGDLFSGIGNTGNDYIYIWIDMTGAGFACVPIWHVQDVSVIAVEYVSSLMPKVNLYTIAATLLALKVLVEKPDDLYMACRSMLEAPTLIREINERWNKSGGE